MFLEREDRALKNKLQGITVTDLRDNEREVDVWFRWPDKEVRDTSFPFLTIEWTGIRRAQEREHRGRPVLDYIPEGFTVADGTDATLVTSARYPVPYELIYTISAWSRNPLHARQLFAAITINRGFIPGREGYLDVPEDKTVRRLDVMSIVQADSHDQATKRIFRTIWNVTVSAEVFQEELAETKKPTSTILDLKGGLTVEEILAANPAAG